VRCHADQNRTRQLNQRNRGKMQAGSASTRAVLGAPEVCVARWMAQADPGANSPDRYCSGLMTSNAVSLLR
jgi:hypothetical protein